MVEVQLTALEVTLRGLLPWAGIGLLGVSVITLRLARRSRWGWFGAGLNQTLLWGGYSWATHQPGLLIGVVALGATYFLNWSGLDFRDLWWLLRNAPRLLWRRRQGSPSSRLAS